MGLKCSAENNTKFHGLIAMEMCEFVPGESNEDL